MVGFQTFPQGFVREGDWIDDFLASDALPKPPGLHSIRSCQFCKLDPYIRLGVSMSDLPHIKKNLPRHSAGSMELKEGTGPITTMCSCGSFLEIYKRDKTFRVQTPESIDPDQTNPNAPWVASPVADVGSSNLIVARVLLQGNEMLDAAMIEGPFDKDAAVAKLHACKESLLACEKVALRMATNIDAIVAQITEHGIDRDNRGRGMNPFPQVLDLDLDCGAFLIQLNRSIKLICELPMVFLAFERTDSNFDYLAKRLSELLGPDVPSPRSSSRTRTP